ncbi:tail protein X [Streptomyces sp. RTd22]|uniref:tail protein X n=1 Tax=Streptomyces sp. RTd22 TaxID=1841249 RepID=UPI000B2BCE6A|nr:tail protein X [Streptomyces sp. RTd22]
MISANSRYASSVTTIITGSDGKSRNVILPKSAGVVSATVRIYAWAEGDRADLVSYRNYGDASQWWRIADVNPQVLNWTKVAVGTRIRIPIV